MTEQTPITIIVPNYNGASTLERTLRSVLDQQYPALELLVVDGGSTDASVEIIKRYDDKITWWVSEKDRGQSDAINKGFARASGEVVNWLCSDDLLEPDALHQVAAAFADPSLDVLVGATRHERVDIERAISISRPSLSSIALMPLCVTIGQPACFYRRRLLDRSPPLDESLHYTMDLDLWCYFTARGAKWAVTDDVLACAIEDGQNKMRTGGPKIAAEMQKVYQRYITNERIPLATWYRRVIYPLDLFRSRHPGRATNLMVKATKAMVFTMLSPFYGGFRRTRSMNWSAYV